YDQANAANMNKYLLVDAANGKRKHNDYTAMWVVGLGPDQNYYLLDIVRDRLNLTQRVAKVMELHRKWKPRDVRYEQYGLMADVQHIKQVQAAETYRFEITEVGGSTPKEDRIKRLVPLFEGGRVWLPRTLHYTDYEGVTRDLVNVFVEQEYKAFPVPMHDDLLDSLARIEEPGHALVAQGKAAASDETAESRHGRWLDGLMKFGTRQFGAASCSVRASVQVPKDMRATVVEVSSLWCPPEQRGQRFATKL